MPYAELPAFMALLRQHEGFGARALEFTILTAARTNMVLPARRCEDEGHVWRIPAEHMKAGIEHEVPLVPAMRALLDQLPGEGEHFFPGQCLSSRGKPYPSAAAMDVGLKTLGHGCYTVHGFRSTFKVWASEQTDYPDELSEMALAHRWSPWRLGCPETSSYHWNNCTGRRQPRCGFRLDWSAVLVSPDRSDGADQQPLPMAEADVAGVHKNSC